MLTIQHPLFPEPHVSAWLRHWGFPLADSSVLDMSPALFQAAVPVFPFSFLLRKIEVQQHDEISSIAPL